MHAPGSPANGARRASGCTRHRTASFVHRPAIASTAYTNMGIHAVTAKRLVS